MRSLRVWRRFYDRVCPGPEAVDLAFKMRCSGWRKNCFDKEKQRLDHAEGPAVQHQWGSPGWFSPPPPQPERGAEAAGAVRGPGPDAAARETGRGPETGAAAEDRWLERRAQGTQEVEEPVEAEAGAVAECTQVAECAQVADTAQVAEPR